jgi:DNA invertase Pin-like site-specific DNA recombinase
MQRELVFNTKKDAPPKRDISVDVRRASADTGKSFTQIADELGLSVTTCITHAKRQGMNVPSRPKLLTRDLIRRIGNLAAKGISAKTIANDASISAVTVYRVIRSDRAIEQSWKQAREQVARARHRSIWSKKMSLSTQRGVKALRQRAPATYAWLYRHDRDWLNTHKPIA